MTPLAYRLTTWLADLAGAAARLLEEAERRLRRCPDCGRSRFYGEPCVR